MADVLDFYADSFQVLTSAYGCTLNLLRSASTAPRPGTMQVGECLATARMSLEHMKVLIFVLYRQLRQHETESSVTIQVPAGLLNNLQIGMEDWEKFWRG